MHQNRSGWQNAHAAAISSLSSVLASKPVSRAWPFMARELAGRGPACGEGAGERSEARKLPDGNHGEIVSGVLKHD